MLAKILILGGTAEAREIADRLVRIGHDVTTSLAGVTRNPQLPDGHIRMGGFGGAAGLRNYLELHHIDILLDATHPYAGNISRNACEAVQNTTTALYRFERPAWQPIEGDHWILVASLQEAALHVPAGAKVFVTTGRKGLQSFFDRGDLSGVVRTVEPIADVLPSRWRAILERPPYALAQEIALFQAEAFTHIVSKNAGSEATRAKLDAARELGLQVLMVQRPVKPNCQIFTDIDTLILRLGTPVLNS